MNFLNPLLLTLAIPVLASVLYAYLKMGKSRRELVSSTFIYKQLRKRSASKKKFKLPLRLFYELLFLSLLIFSLAGFYFNTPSEKILVVYDNSVSTTANSATGYQASIFDLQIEELKKNLSVATDKYKICKLAPVYTCLSDSFNSNINLKSQIKDLNPELASDNLNSVINQQLAKVKADQVWLYTDQAVVAKSDKIKIMNKRPINYSNIAIKNAYFQEESLKIQLKSFSEAEVKFKVSVRSYQFKDKELIEFDLNEESSEITAQEDMSLSLSLVASYQSADLISIELSAPEDKLAYDNHYWLLPPRKKSSEVLFVSNDQSAKKDLEKILQQGVQYLQPDEYLSAGKSQYKLIVFKNFIPKELPEVNHLVLGANSSSDSFKMSLEQNVEIVGWESAHPILDYLDAKSFSVKTAWLADLPEIYRPVFWSNSGGLLEAFETRSQRGVYLSFPLLPFKGAENKPLSILTLNIFKWLNQPTTARQSSQIKKDDQLENLYYINNGSPVSSSSLDLPSVRYVSRYSSDYLAINNFYSERESNILDNSTVRIESEPQLIDKQTSSFSSKLLLQFVLIMFLAGMFLWSKKT